MQRFVILSTLLVASLVLTSSTAFGQHFEPATEDGISHSIVIQAASINDADLVDGDEIGVFTSGGVCAGAVIIEGDPTWGLAAFGDDPSTEEEVEGFLVGEEFTFLLYDESENSEYEAVIHFGDGDQTWQVD